MKLDNLGKAGRIIVSKDSTIIVDGFVNKIEIKNRVKQLKTHGLNVHLNMKKKNYMKDYLDSQRV